MTPQGTLHDILRYESQVILIGCDLVPKKRVLCAVVYFAEFCPETLPLFDEEGNEQCLLVIPKSHQWCPTFQMASSINDDLQFEVL